MKHADKNPLPKDWTVEDWRDLRDTMEAFNKRLRERHAADEAKGRPKQSKRTPTIVGQSMR